MKFTQRTFRSSESLLDYIQRLNVYTDNAKSEIKFFNRTRARNKFLDNEGLKETSPFSRILKVIHQKEI